MGARRVFPVSRLESSANHGEITTPTGEGAWCLAGDGQPGHPLAGSIQADLSGAALEAAPPLSVPHPQGLTPRTKATRPNGDLPLIGIRSGMSAASAHVF